MLHYDQFIENSRPFMRWMLDWYNGLPALTLDEVIQGQPQKVAITCVDVIKGFTTVGPLASPRIEGIIDPIAALFAAAWERGVREMVLIQDTHPEDAVEFGQYAPHCIVNTEEAETVDAFQALPFFDAMEIIPKNSINAAAGTSFDEWLKARPQVQTYITVGDCSDICTYQLATHLRVWANAEQRQNVRVIAPVNTIDTYDLPVELAQQIGATPHPGDLLHVVFLYHMMLNGIEVVKCLDLK